MYTSVKEASRVVCVRSIDYELPIDSTLHPAFMYAARRRMFTALNTTNSRHASILKYALSHPVAKSVWAIVLEEANNPVYVVHNLACSRTTLPFRRVLLVKCDDILQEPIEYNPVIVGKKYDNQLKLIDLIVILVTSIIICHNIILLLTSHKC